MSVYKIVESTHEQHHKSPIDGLCPTIPFKEVLRELEPLMLSPTRPVSVQVLLIEGDSKEVDWRVQADENIEGGRAQHSKDGECGQKCLLYLYESHEHISLLFYGVIKLSEEDRPYYYLYC